ncbi:AmmeMemoRadiSam system protein B [Chloroflexota bacterium]
MIRRSAVAGQFYPGTYKQLKDMVASLVPEGLAKADVLGCVVPHAGFVYSGEVAGVVYSRIELPETAVIIGPNHTGKGKPFAMIAQGGWETPLGAVGIDSPFAERLLTISHYLKEDPEAHRLEHSVEVQLPFLQYLKPDIKVVPVVLGYGTGDIYCEIGREIGRVARELGTSVLVIASSDMTHYEPHSQAKGKDEKAIEAILALDEEALLERVDRLGITMCGYAPAVCMISAARVLGAGTGELVGYKTSGDTTGDFESVVGYAGIILKRMHPLAELARQAVDAYVTGGEKLSPKELTPEMKDKAGVFVSIHKGSSLRGCIGTYEPYRANVAGEIITNAISSASTDPRFLPVTADDLPFLSYSVDVLSPPEPVSGEKDLNPQKYGVIVERGERRGLLLPDLEGVETPHEQITICRQKAGIDPIEPVRISRFQVKRYH